MSISSELTALQTNLAAAKAAVTSKGGTVGDTGLAGLASEIATIPSGGQEPSSGATLTAYDPDTGVLTGTGLGSAGTVLLLDRNTNYYVAKETTSWSDTSITLATPIDLSTLEGTTSIAVMGTDGKWSTKLLLTGEVAVTGWAKLYIKDPDTGVVRTITVDNSTDFNKLYSPSSSVYARAITIGTDTFYADELVGMQFGEDFTGTSLSNYFLRDMTNLSQPIAVPSSVTSVGYDFLNNCRSLNQPLDLSNITSISIDFLSGCTSFNQPLDLSSVTTVSRYFLSGCRSFNQSLDLSSATSIGSNFLSDCYSFNQPLDLSSVTSIDGSFLSECYSFNQSLDLSSVTSISGYFLNNCYSFNQPLDLSNVTSIGSSKFLYGCRSFNQPLDLSSVASIGSEFLRYCYSFNQSLDLSSATSIGDNFLSDCPSFNQPLDLSSVTSTGSSFLYGCSSFNQPLDLSNVTSIGSNFLSDCYSFNQPLGLSNVTSIGGSFLNNCYSFNQPLDLSNVTSIGGGFLYGCSSFNQPLALPSTVAAVGTSFLYNCHAFSDLTVETTVSPTDNASLSCNNKNSKMYAKGITVKGAGASTWITNLPDITSSPYRKLINGNE